MPATTLKEVVEGLKDTLPYAERILKDTKKAPITEVPDYVFNVNAGETVDEGGLVKRHELSETDTSPGASIRSVACSTLCVGGFCCCRNLACSAKAGALMPVRVPQKHPPKDK